MSPSYWDIPACAGTSGVITRLARGGSSGSLIISPQGERTGINWEHLPQVPRDGGVSVPSAGDFGRHQMPLG